MTQSSALQHACKNAVIYCRVSSIAQTKRGAGLESQETRCREHAKYKGYSVVEIFKDDLSGGYVKRPGMEAMLAFLRKNRRNPHVVIIDDISRLARDVKAHIELRAAITMAGGILESPSIEFGYDADSELQEYILATVSQHQRKKNAEQTLNRMQARVMSGYYCFAVPMGYVYCKIDGHGRVLMRDEPMAGIIQEGLEGFASGRFQTQAEVMRFFQGFPEFPKTRDGVVLIQTITNILTRPVYAGYVEAPSWGISLRKGKHEGLVSFETFQKIQERLRTPSKAPARKDLNADFPLRGAVLCADCHSPLTACWSKGSHGLYPYYLCHRRSCASYRKSIARNKIEGEFEALLKGLQPTQSLFRIVRAMLKDIWDYRQSHATESVKTAKLELNQLERQIEQLLDRVVEASSQTVIAAYEQRLAKLETEKLIMQERIEKGATPRYSFEEMFERSVIFLSDPWKLWASDKLTLKRMVLKLAFAERLVYDRKTGFRTPDFSLPFKALSDLKNGVLEMAHPERFERPAF